jgi:hypothetical protein
MLMQSRNSMGFQSLDDTVKDQTDAYCGDKETDDAGLRRQRNVRFAPESGLSAAIRMPREQ